jgi:hypothetical protein
LKYIFFFLLTGSFFLVSCSNSKQGNNFLYDMGTERFQAEKGYIRITPAMTYDSVKGYGWLHAPSSAFDTLNEKLHNRSLCSGVLGKDSLVYRADLPNGDYYLTLSMGNKDSIPMKMLVTVNDQVLTDTIIAPWYRLAYKTVRQKISVNENKAIIQVKGLGTGVGLYAVELRPAEGGQSIYFSDGLNEDTATVKALRADLLKQLKNDTANTALLNQLDITGKYLLACYYFDGGGWSWAAKETGFSLIYRMYAAADLLEQVIADTEDPLYDRARYLLARIYYWLDQEDNNAAHEKKARAYFTSLHDAYPKDEIIRMYLGEKIKEEATPETTRHDAPRWAVYQHEATHRMLKIIHWWVTMKQTANGELGGKYGDDVEILRWWLPAVLGVDDSLARVGYNRLADGVWNSGILERGFARRVDDVEHSAELFRDTHPGMFLINYGDPEYIERCMISMQNFRDVWTGITPLGHRHFRSYYLSATEVVPQFPYGVDVAMNARALLPGLWAAWYNENPSIVQLFEQWSKAWIADAARADNGKPAGVLPSAVAFAGDRIGGDSPHWYDPALTYDYYNWDHLGHVNELQYHLMGMYAITKNAFYLSTVNFYNNLITKAREEKESAPAAPGSIEWIKQQLLTGGADHDPGQNPMGKVFAMAKQLTRNNQYDSLVKEYGQPYNQYSITQSNTVIENGLESILETLRYNFPLLTSEVKFTDRVYIPGINLLSGMYTGHFGAGYEYPALIVSWKNTGKDVAIFVKGGDDKTVRASLYNFSNEKKIEMRTWQLQPGLYKVHVGIDRNDDGLADENLSDTTIELKERVNDIPLHLPAGKLITVSVEQLKAYQTVKAPKPDLALAARDISLNGNTNEEVEIQAVIHNTGNATAHNSKVLLSVDGLAKDSVIITLLEAPNDLKPRSKQVIFKLKPLQGMHTLSVSVLCNQPEVTTMNNIAYVKTQVVDGKIAVSF